MRTPRFVTATLAVGLVILLVAPLATAQTAFVLDEPVLLADGRRVPVEGAPLRQDRFGTLVLAVPGIATYTIADAPFEGARRAGEFDGDALVFAAEGVSVRLRGREALLGTSRRPAYVRTRPNPARGGTATLRLGGAMDAEMTSRRANRTTERSAARRATPQRTAPSRVTAERVQAEPLRAEVTRLRREVVRLSSEQEEMARQGAEARRGLLADVERVRRERDALRDEREQALGERAALARSLEEARREMERLRERAQADRSRRADRDRAEAQRLEADLERLRRQIASRDASISTLTAERDDRSAQIVRLQGQVVNLTASLTTRTQERDEARRERNVARAQLAEATPRSDAEMARLRAEVDRLDAALTETRAERDRLAQLTSVQTPELEARESEMDRLLEELDAARARIGALETQLAVSESARLALETEQVATQSAGGAERDALEAERNDPREQVDALRNEVERLRRDEAPSAPRAPVALDPEPTGAQILFPGFDFGRLQNPDEVRQRIDSTPPASRTGDVLVLFQTDATGRVIRTAVPRPLGGDLDARAEQLVRSMIFRPARVDGIPTGLRSQVLVRFGAER
ncbi:MAG: hypothetical protein AAGI52_04940 [Bacteroidota bacterium]